MAGVEFIEGGEIVGRRVDCLCGERDETIGDTAERRDHNDGRSVDPIYDLLDLQHSFGRSYGGAAEFENFHRKTCIEREKMTFIIMVAFCLQGRSHQSFTLILTGFDSFCKRSRAVTT